PAYPQPFNSIPLRTPSGVPYYDMVISAAGYNTSVQEVENASGSLACPTTGFSNACNFNLEHGYLAGTTDLSTPNDTGNQLNVVVTAEDSGTDRIENFGLSTISGGASSGSFSMPVPDTSPSSARSLPVTNYDVFGTVQDLFQTSPQHASGHSIAAVPSIGAPNACATIGVSPPLSLSPFDCVGLGSVFGSVNSANPNTTSVRLSKNGVQLMETEPNSIGAPPSGNTYNFCAPSDSYTLTHYESGVAGASTSVALAAPVAVSSPCASICQNAQTSNGNCLLCQPTSAPALP
ncbi:MAG: hypothetical protein JO166_02795, partial [Deltaproteobacteria bacterium]|nr:hypothetical protein [Deltaproteobacteria bacterium]